jgi:hypothetical protein
MPKDGRAREGTLILVLGLASCGPPLGIYRFEEVRAVTPAALEAVDPGQYPDPEAAFLLRIEFSSPDDLEARSEGGDLYVHADFCPLRDPFRIWVHGPYYGDRSRYNATRRYERLPDGRIHVTIEGENRHPPRDPRTHRYVYTAYLIPYIRANPAPGAVRKEGYDLRAASRDLCLRIDHPGYYLTPSRSATFVVPRAAIAQALREMAGPTGLRPRPR